MIIKYEIYYKIIYILFCILFIIHFFIKYGNTFQGNYDRHINHKRDISLIENGVMSQVSVELGASADQYSEVVSGELQEGDVIVLNPPSDFGMSHGGPFGG